jgi:sugar-phosphatase
MCAKIDAALIDMDGTLIDSKPIIAKAWRTIACEFGLELSQSTMDEHVHGRSGSYTLNHIFKGFTAAEKSNIKRKVDGIEQSSVTALIPGALDALNLFRKNGIKMALVTASWESRIDFVFSLHDLHDYFDVIVSQGDVTAGKPDPEGYLLAAQKLGCNIENCVVFEDSLSGIAAGTQSGATCIAIGDLDTSALTAVASYSDFNHFLSRSWGLVNGRHGSCKS